MAVTNPAIRCADIAVLSESTGRWKLSLTYRGVYEVNLKVSFYLLSLQHVPELAIVIFGRSSSPPQDLELRSLSPSMEQLRLEDEHFTNANVEPLTTPI